MGKKEAYYAMPRICPVCKMDGDEGRFLQNFENEVKWSLYECGRCHVQFWLPLNIQSESQYEEDVQYVGKRQLLEKRNAHTIAGDSWNKAQFVQDFPSRSSGKKKLLDIGCGTGEFLFVVGGMGYDAQGIDFNKHAIEVAQEKLGLSNVSTMNLYDFLKDKQGTYDIVTAFEVIEHVDDPGSFVKLIGSALKKGGQFVLSTPNRDRYWGHISMALEPWDFPYNHLLRWNQKSLRAFIAGRGFKVIKEKKKYPIDWFVAVLGWLAALFPKKGAKEDISRVDSLRGSIGFSRFHFIKEVVLSICSIPAFIMAHLLCFEGRDLYMVFEKE